MRAESLTHTQKLLQLCVNSVQDWVSVSKTVCVHFCNQHKKYAEPFIMLDKNAIKALTEAKFLWVVFDRTLSCKSHVDYLRTSCLKTLDILKVEGNTDWGVDRKSLRCLYRSLVRSKLDCGCIVYGAASTDAEPDPIHHQGSRITLGVFPTSSATSLSVSFKNRCKKLPMSYVLKLKTMFFKLKRVLTIQLTAVFLNHQTEDFLKNLSWLRLLVIVFYHWLRIQRLTRMWLMTSQCQTPLPGVNLNTKSVCLWQILKTAENP